MVIHPEDTQFNSESPKEEQDRYTDDNQGEKEDKEFRLNENRRLEC